MQNKVIEFFYRFKYRFARELRLRVPVDVSLELASVCNQRCSYCYHADQKNLPFKPGMMKWETIETIVRQSAELGVHSIKFNWKGESTLNPHFHQATALARSLAGGSTFIDRLTNSNFKFSPMRDDIFSGLANQTKVKVSFDSFRKDVLEKQRAGANYEIAIRNIDRFYNHEERRKSETKIVIQAVRTALNADEDLEWEIKKRWPEATASIRDMVRGRVDNAFVDEVGVRDRGPERQACIQAFARVIFNANGKAFPCCPDIGEQLQIGDIEKQHLRTIFNGLTARWLRADLKTGAAFKESPCKTCSSYESFKGYKPNWTS